MRAPPSAADRSNLGWGSQALAGSTKQLSNRTSSSHRSSSGLFTISKTLISNLGRSLICFQLLSPEIQSLAAHNRSISKANHPNPNQKHIQRLPSPQGISLLLQHAGRESLDAPWQNTRVSWPTPFRGMTIHTEKLKILFCVMLQKGTSQRIQGIQTSLDLPTACLGMPAGANNKWRSLFSCKGQDNCSVYGIASLFESSASRNFSFF